MKRWPIIRHIRWFYLNSKFNHWWFSVGRHYWLAPNESDLEYLNNVWDGKE